jgi:serine protease
MTFVGHDPKNFGLPSGYDGTSMAAPHVSGVVALLLASGLLGPHPSPDAVMARLKQTAIDLGAPGYDRRYGSGLISANRVTDPAIRSSG